MLATIARKLVDDFRLVAQHCEDTINLPPVYATVDRQLPNDQRSIRAFRRQASEEGVREVVVSRTDEGKVAQLLLLCVVR